MNERRVALLSKRLDGEIGSVIQAERRKGDREPIRRRRLEIDRALDAPGPGREVKPSVVNYLDRFACLFFQALR